MKIDYLDFNDRSTTRDGLECHCISGYTGRTCSRQDYANAGVIIFLLAFTPFFGVVAYFPVRYLQNNLAAAWFGSHAKKRKNLGTSKPVNVSRIGQESIRLDSICSDKIQADIFQTRMSTAASLRDIRNVSAMYDNNTMTNTGKYDAISNEEVADYYDDYDFKPFTQTVSNREYEKMLKKSFVFYLPTNTDFIISINYNTNILTQKEAC